MSKKILYVDMDNVLVDFPAGLARIDEATLTEYEGHVDDIPGLFGLMPPLPGAIEAYEELSQLYDTYILSTAPWENPSAWIDKLQWVKKHMGHLARKRLILSHHKNLNMGEYLVDDRPDNGTAEFTGEHIHFGQKAFPDWATVLNYLRNQA